MKINMLSVVLINLIFSLIFKLVVVGIKCYENEKNSICYNTKIDDKQIICNGYRSCYSSKLNALSLIRCGGLRSCAFAENITTSENILCNGEYSCVRAKDLNGGYISCNGDHGCAYIDSIKSLSTDIHCDGNYGCYQSFLIESKSDLYCNGNYGCFGSEYIKSGNNIYCNGEYSCANNKYQIIAYNYIECGGSNSCINATDIISTARYNGKITCSSDNACQNANYIQGYNVEC